MNHKELKTPNDYIFVNPHIFLIHQQTILSLAFTQDTFPIFTEPHFPYQMRSWTK